MTRPPPALMPVMVVSPLEIGVGSPSSGTRHTSSRPRRLITASSESPSQMGPPLESASQSCRSEQNPIVTGRSSLPVRLRSSPRAVRMYSSGSA